MERGLYEALLTTGLHEHLSADSSLRADIDEIDAADQPHVLSRHVQSLTERVLSATTNPADRLTIVNGLIDQLEAAAGSR